MTSRFLFRCAALVLTALAGTHTAAAQSCKPLSVPDGCMDPARVADPDVRANLEKFKCGGLCYREKTVTIKGSEVRLQFVTNPARRRGPVWVVPHDNEDSAFDTAVYSAIAYGGGFVAVENAERRILPNGVDPNRAFGSAKVKCTGRGVASSSYTKAVMEFAGTGNLFLSLHSNDDGHGNGRGHISAERKKAGALHGFMSPNPRTQSLADGDNAILLAGTEAANEGNAAALVSHFTNAGINVIYEQVKRARNDCSLSNYLVAERGAQTGNYYNIEVQHCATSTQMTMANLLLESQGFRPVTKEKWVTSAPRCPR